MVNLELQDIIESLSPAYRIGKPPEVTAPFVFNFPHSGRIYPKRFIDSTHLSPLELRSSEDAYVDELMDRVTDAGARSLVALFPRAYLDLNRHPYELDPKLFSSPMPPFAQTDTLKVKSGLGVIARIVAEGREIYKGPLTLQDALTRINRLYFPYHVALRKLMNETKQQFHYAVMIDCHSMPSASIPGHRLIRPDFVIGDRFGTSCAPALTRLAASSLEAFGYRVAVNKPYAGGHLTKEYGRPQDDFHALQIEINRSLYLDEARVQKSKGFERLRQDLASWSCKLMLELPDLSDRGLLAAE